MKLIKILKNQEGNPGQCVTVYCPVFQVLRPVIKKPGLE